MPKEIERKFLVQGDYKPFTTKTKNIVQGYLSSIKERVVRVRIQENKAYLTIKGISKRISRYEWEKEISKEEANELLKLCEKGVIEKYRHYIPVGKHIFEVDEFLGENLGLVIAEIELQSENETFQKPNWLGQEVTHDKRYFNTYLKDNSFKDW